MAPSLSEMLRPQSALIFRITHIENVSWILQNGLHCQNSTKSDPNFRTIGDLDLIEKRHNWSVHQDPGGTLSDYVSFYFTPSSIMLYRVTTESGSLSSSEIAIIVTSLHRISDSLMAIGCYSESEKQVLEEYRREAGMDRPRIVVRPN